MSQMRVRKRDSVSDGNWPFEFGEAKQGGRNGNLVEEK